jgi:hypothetical protein
MTETPNRKTRLGVFCCAEFGNRPSRQYRPVVESSALLFAGDDDLAGPAAAFAVFA